MARSLHWTTNSQSISSRTIWRGEAETSTTSEDSGQKLASLTTIPKNRESDSESEELGRRRSWSPETGDDFRVWRRRGARVGEGSSEGAREKRKRKIKRKKGKRKTRSSSSDGSSDRGYNTSAVLPDDPWNLETQKFLRNSAPECCDLQNFKFKIYKSERSSFFRFQCEPRTLL